MESATLRFGPTLAEAARLWWHNRSSFAVIAAVLVAPLALVEALGHELDVAPDLGWAVALGLSALIVAAVVEAFGAGLADHLLYFDRLGRSRQPWWRYARTLPLLNLVALALIIGVAVTVGVILLVLPGFAAYAWLALAPPAASFERAGVLGALRRSAALVRGRFWRVAALTTATFVPAVLADTIGSTLRSWHSPEWLSILVEAVCEAIVIGMTAAVVVVVYHTLRTHPRESGAVPVVPDNGGQ